MGYFSRAFQGVNIFFPRFFKGFVNFPRVFFKGSTSSMGFQGISRFYKGSGHPAQGGLSIEYYNFVSSGAFSIGHK